MTVAYVDASAVIAAYADEGDASLTSILDTLEANHIPLTSSQLVVVEVRRFLHRLAKTEVDDTADVMVEDLALIPLSETVLALAGSIQDQHLGTLDALHLASALLVRADVLVTRDRQLARAATAAGITVL